MSIEIKCDACGNEIRSYEEYHIWCDKCIGTQFDNLRRNYALKIQELQAEIEELKEGKK